MAEGVSAAAAEVALDAIAAEFTWVKLHTGAPGANGTANAATNTTRKQVTWNAASGNSIDNSSAPEWASVPAGEDYTHFTAWSEEAAGTFGLSGTVTATAVGSGDTFRLPAGSITGALSALAS